MTGSLNSELVFLYPAEHSKELSEPAADILGLKLCPEKSVVRGGRTLHAPIHKGSNLGAG